MSRPVSIRILAAALFVPAMALAASQTNGLPDRTKDPPDQVQEQGSYRIGAGDVLRIHVWKNADLSLEAPVRPDGMISLPLLNDVRAAGLTPRQLKDRLVARLTGYVSTPEVSVIVLQVNSFKVTVLGKVRQPGRFSLTGPTTVLDVLAMAGGFEQFEGGEEAYVLRARGSGYERIPVKYSTAVSAAGKSVNLDLQPGDFVIVP